MLKRCTHHNDLLVCVLCREPIELERAKTDGDGKGVHEECLVQKMIFDGRAKMSKLPPHLVERDKEKCCSVCGTIFKPDGQVSISKAFMVHLRKKHIPVLAVTKVTKSKSAQTR